MDNIKIEKMNLTDLEAIKNILASNFDDFWNYNILKEELQNENSKYLVAKIDCDVVGFAGIKIVLDEADIMNIVVKKDFRNQGIGKLLLKDLLALCSEIGIITINLEVNEDNLHAIHLYENFGFKKISVRKNYYKDKDGLFMRKVL